MVSFFVTLFSLFKFSFLITIYISCDAAESVLSCDIVVIKKRSKWLKVKNTKGVNSIELHCMYGSREEKIHLRDGRADRMIVRSHSLSI